MLVFLTYQLSKAILRHAAEASFADATSVTKRTMQVCFLAIPVWPEKCWYAKLSGVQYIADTHYQIIGSGPQDPQDRRLCKIAFNLSPDRKNWPLKLKQCARKIAYSCLSLSPVSKN
jgi:hypothetical protein